MSNAATKLSAMQTIVANKAANDEAFRKAFLANPNATVEKEFNVSLPGHIKITPVEAGPETFVVVVPKAAAKGGELKDEDLEAVAGGSKSGAKNFFNGVGDAIVDTATEYGSALGSAGVAVTSNLRQNVNAAINMDFSQANLRQVC